MTREEKLTEFLSNEEINAVLFNEVPPVITLFVRYLEHIDGDVFALKTYR